MRMSRKSRYLNLISLSYILSSLFSINVVRNIGNTYQLISKMFFSRSGYAAFLLLAARQSFVFASIFNEQNNTEALARRFVKSVHLPLINGIKSVMNSSEWSCTKEITALLAAIDGEEMWALEMLDASSKIQSGILQGNTVDIGMYDQCIAITKEYNEVNVQGKHCMVTFGRETFKMTSSVCLPSSCNETQAFQIMNFMIKNLLANSSLGMEIKVTAARCAQVNFEGFTIGEILTIAFFAVVGAFILFCTMCDIFKRNWPNKTSAVTVNTLAKFSLCTNVLVILNTKVKPGTMPAINGIRFLSTCWIVALHNYSVLLLKPIINGVYPPLALHSFGGVWHEMATFATDNFFFISGFLTSYLFFKSMRSGRKFNLPMMYVHRYIRLTPCVAVLALFVSVLFYRIGNGPMYSTLSSVMVNGCRENWWFNILYIQNFLSPMDICLMQSWFLAADMQLFLVSPIILYPLYRWPKYGLSVWSLFLLASVVTPAVIVGLNGYTIIGYPSIESFDNYYIRSYTRAFPYLTAILLGSEIASNKRRLTQGIVMFGWTATCILIVLCYLAISRLKNTGIEYNLAFQIACAILVRPFWSIAMAWIIYACTQGHGGIAARFLSAPIFLPLTRLSYGIYLVHEVIMFLGFNNSLNGLSTASEMFKAYLGNMVWSIAASALISLFFDMPIMTMETLLRNGGRKQEQTPPVRDLNDKNVITKPTWTQTRTEA